MIRSRGVSCLIAELHMVCRMKDLTIPRSLVLLLVLSFCVVCGDTMGSGEELMNTDTAEMILLSTSQYCLRNISRQLLNTF